VNFGPVIPDISKGEIEIFATTGQRTGQKSAYFNEYLSKYWTDLLYIFSTVDICTGIIKLT